MALSVNTNWECNASATANNVNGGGFNPSNTNFLTDGTVDTNTGNTASPVFSSASYNFVAGDVGHWLFVKSGTNTIPGYYQIASVASNKATLTASIGSANIVDTTLGYPTPKWTASAGAGIATIGTPTSITFGVDYSRSTTAKVNGVADFNATGSSTTLTSATAGFTPVMVGNIFHQTTAGTGAFGVAGWYEIVSYTNATTVVLDRTPNSGTASVNTTGYVGGAQSLNSTTDDALFENFTGTNGTGGMRCFMKNGTFTLGQSISIGTGAGATTAPVVITGYNTIRGDNPTGTNRPTINTGTNSCTWGIYYDTYNIIFTGTAATIVFGNTGTKTVNCKFVNSSTTAARTACGPSAANFAQSCEYVSYRGIAVSYGAAGFFANGLYIHDSDVGINPTSINSALAMTNSLIVGCVTTGISCSAATNLGVQITNCTFYGAENKLGVGFNGATGLTSVRILNSIFYGFTTGISITDTQTVMYSDCNDYFNNTADVSKWIKATTDIATTPAFTSVTQITGTAATVTGGSGLNILAAASGTPFSVLTANTDYIQLVSGTGTGFAAGIYLVTAVGGGGANVTLSSNIISSGNGSSIVWQSTYGRNFSVGANMAGLAFPGTFDSTATTSFMDIGAVQRNTLSTVGYPFVS